MSVLSTTEALSRVSHEFRNPLNAILAFGQLLALDDLSDSQRHSVEQILAGGRHLLALAEDLLELSRLAGGDLELSEATVDARDEIAQAVSLSGPLAAEKSLTLRHLSGEEPLWVLADHRRLKQVLLNLISNAINYNRPGGSITLRATRDGSERVRIDVIDTGVGLSADQLSRLFTPFERLDAPLRGVEGNGLGLVVCKALTEAMGGSIEVVSSPGSGSVFSLRLPAAGAPCEALRPRTKRVLAPAA
ncbi:MAG TPA: HAMP domain-containing sensor histidine kinase [Solirubrobacteraceae bacterium]|nr:HAMP domain-containing sensor histidine kinase [Solirubrobacteraceae bacterium]